MYRHGIAAGLKGQGIVFAAGGGGHLALDVGSKTSDLYRRARHRSSLRIGHEAHDRAEFKLRPSRKRAQQAAENSNREMSHSTTSEDLITGVRLLSAYPHENRFR